jgi:hypothetical protein
MIDKELKNLGQFYGTNEYHRISLFSNIIGTDGIKYLMDNGYSWAVTDAVVIVDKVLKNKDWVTIELKVNKEKENADIIYSDGNGNELYKQHYKWTDVKRDVKMFAVGDTLMLTGEY